MARPREFDVEWARDQALRLFWRMGYRATALPDLTAAMGISRSSRYAAFGDKRGFFVSCLDLLAERTLQVLAHARAKRAPLDALQAFLERLERAGAARPDRNLFPAAARAVAGGKRAPFLNREPSASPICCPGWPGPCSLLSPSR